VGEPIAGVKALVDAVGAVLRELVAEALGSGSNVICIANVAPLQPVLLPLLPPAPVLGAWVELCSVTSLTPLIRRSRSSVSATIAWLVAQPASVKVGTLPGGVDEATLAPVAPAAAVEFALVEAVLAEAESLAVPEDEDPPLLDPIVPDSVVSETCPGGNTRPSSWKA
jgi:hypothetical protein